MSDIAEIYSALMDARASNDGLDSFVRGVDAREMVRHRRRNIEDGIAALERLRGQLRDGRKHIEPPDDYRITSCQCSAPNASPPCSWCTEPHDDNEE